MATPPFGAAPEGMAAITGADVDRIVARIRALGGWPPGTRSSVSER